MKIFAKVCLVKWVQVRPWHLTFLYLEHYYHHTKFYCQVIEFGIGKYAHEIDVCTKHLQNVRQQEPASTEIGEIKKA